MAEEGVERACCVYDNEKKKIVLFYEGWVDKKDLLGHLKVSLPQYMVPSNVRQLDKLPVNKNGKIDRGALKKLYEEKKAK
jgi:acyl-coenzyme A synthetase/AMP-(fatty) acid ligase